MGGVQPLEVIKSHRAQLPRGHVGKILGVRGTVEAETHLQIKSCKATIIEFLNVLYCSFSNMSASSCQKDANNNVAT